MNEKIWETIEGYFNKLFQEYIRNYANQETFENYKSFFKKFSDQNELKVKDYIFNSFFDYKLKFATYFYIFKVARDFFNKLNLKFDMNHKNIIALVKQKKVKNQSFYEYLENVHHSLIKFVFVNISLLVFEKILKIDVQKAIISKRIKSLISVDQIVFPLLKIIEYSTKIDDYIIEITCLRTFIENVYLTIKKENRKAKHPRQANIEPCVNSFCEDLSKYYKQKIYLKSFKSFPTRTKTIYRLLNKEIHEMNYIKNKKNVKLLNINLMLQEASRICIYVLFENEFITQNSYDTLKDFCVLWSEKNSKYTW